MVALTPLKLLVGDTTKTEYEAPCLIGEQDSKQCVFSFGCWHLAFDYVRHKTPQRRLISKNRTK